MIKAYVLLKNNKGQTAIEFILLSILMLSLALSLATYVKSSSYISNYSAGPWQSLGSMIEHGTWGQPAQAKAMNPNYGKRSVTLLGEVQ